MACALEKKSEHPLAKAVLKKAEEEKLVPEEVTGFQALPGNGLSAVLGNDTPDRRKYEIYQQSRPVFRQSIRDTGRSTGRTGKDAASFCQKRRASGNHRSGRCDQGGQSAGR